MKTTDWTAPIHIEGHTGQAVVLVHGFTGHPGHWLPLSEVLAQCGDTVVAPRLPGHGTEPADLAGTDADQWTEAVIEAAATVADHRQVHLMGLSMGGLLSVLAARPTAAASVVAINSPVRVHDRRVLLSPYFWRLVTSTPARGSMSPDPNLAHLWLPYPSHPTVSVAELVGLTRRAWKEAGRLRRPALVVQSRTDETVRPVSGAMLARRLGAELVWLDHARHNALLDPGRSRLHIAIVDHLGRMPGH